MSDFSSESGRTSGTSWREWALYVWAGIVVGVLMLHLIWPQPGEGDVRWAWPLGLMPFPVAGAVVLARRPRNGVGRTLHVIGIAAFVIFFTWWLAFAVYDHPASAYIEALGNSGVLVSFGGIAVLLHLFPTGQPIGRRHRLVVRAMWALIAAASLLATFDPAIMPSSGRVNPLGVLPESMPVLEAVIYVPLLILVAAGVGVLFYRRIKADLVERLQLRWFLTSAVVALIVFGVFVSPLLETFGDPDDSIGEVLFGVLIVVGMFWSIPIAITIAVLRYRLFEIDRLVSRTVSYLLVMAVLAGIFAGLIVGIQTLLPAQGDLAVAASTLAAAALFNPLRRRMQSSVDRRFNRSKYDAQAEIDALSVRLREAHDRDEIAAGMLGVVRNTMQPSTVGIWVRDG